MSAHFTTPTDELLLLAETLGEVKTKADKLEAEFATQARPLEAATNALSAALSGIKALQFHVLDNNLGQLSARVEEMRKAVDEQVGVIALELKKADETNAAKAGQEAEALRSEIAALQAQLGTLGAQFSAQLERVEFSAKEEAKKLQLIPGPAGAAGASLNPRGTFIDGETYNRLDVVSWLGSSYIAAVDGVTEKPSKNSNQWQVLASRGGGAAGGAGDFGSLAGVAQINQGGTGQTTRAAGLNALLPDQAGATQYMLLTDGAGNVSWGAQPVAGLPSQTGNSGKLLTTNGTSASWSNAVTVSGSNATVTGTLTVNSTFASTSSGTTLTSQFSNTLTGATNVLNLQLRRGDSANGFSRLMWNTGSTTEWSFGSRAGDTNLYVWDEVANAERLKIASSTGNVSIASTTASTTTSSGALVVGNGTSGGLGVGGAITLGSNLTSTASDGKIVVSGSGNTTGTKELQFVRADGGDSTVLGLAGSAYAGVLTGLGNNDAYLYTSSAYAFRIFVGTSSRYDFTSSQFKINPTTISNSTSSGALVVAGGVGVGGNVTVGGQLDLNSGTASAPSLKLNGTNNGIYYTGSNIVRIAANATEAATFSATAATVAGTLTAIGAISASSLNTTNGTTVGPFTTSIGADATLGALTVSIGGSPSATGASRFGYIGAGDSQDWRRFIVGSNNTSGGGQVLVPSTLSSTSTSSGALVVSGGVGVAGAIFAGGNIQCNAVYASNNTTLYLRPQGATVSSGEAQLTTTGNLTLNGSVQTSAPSGGTAAAWKLGTVATVSPTSPNRTIEVDIGGTIYYIHAKTTNN